MSDTPPSDPYADLRKPSAGFLRWLNRFGQALAEVHGEAAQEHVS